MAGSTNPEKAGQHTGKLSDPDAYVHKAYIDQIAWYWRTSKSNKNSYKSYRYLTIVLGSLVTLIASLSSSEIIALSPFWTRAFAIATPILAFVLTVTNSLSQNFQWGATWRDMVINASRLEKEKNRFLATPPAERNHKKELILINDIVLEETQAFFRRILDTEAVPIETPEPQDQPPAPPEKVG